MVALKDNLCYRSDSRAAKGIIVEYITPFIATVVAIIALFQWDTARQKVVLDLFDKRFEVYDELRLIVSKYITTGISVEDTRQFGKVCNRASFLFGQEVTSYLDIIRKDVDQACFDELRLANSKRAPIEEFNALEVRSAARSKSFGEFPSSLDALVAPYMKHTQKQSPYLVWKQLD